MSTFVVHVVAEGAQHFHGTVRHVGAGEEAAFSSVSDLVGFIRGMSAISALKEGDRDPDGRSRADPDSPSDASDPDSRIEGP